MSKSDDLLKKIRSLTEGNTRPENPPEPDASSRKSFLISFDNGKGSTDGMLDALRSGGYHAWTKSRFPRTTIVCRTAPSVPEKSILRTVSETLEDNGSATVAQIGSGHVSVWPDQPWEAGEAKIWKKVMAYRRRYRRASALTIESDGAAFSKPMVKRERPIILPTFERRLRTASAVAAIRKAMVR